SLTSTIGPIEYRMVRQFVIKRLSQLDNVSSKRSNAFGRSSQKKLPQDIVDRVDLYIDAYRSLVIVEARRSKELYPYEGILLVRQGKPSIDQAATYY
ncbi:MAG TPA: hypothetical protein VGT44_01555, partial [Ktedonobacteraceae bacterium]|nr:hypothetical protein [Ktedonobacteraceae bacterium]